MPILRLQRFAGEKTERATPKRREDARKEGNVVKSAELTSALVLAAVLVVLRLTGQAVWQNWQSLMNRDLTMPVPTQWTPKVVSSMLLTQGTSVVRALIPIIGIALVIGVGVAVVQVRPMFALNLLTPKFSRVNPLQGVQRMFSAKSLVELGKSVLKLTIVGATSYTLIVQMARQIESFGEMNVDQIPLDVGNMVFSLGIRIAAMMVALAFLDYLYQRYEYEKGLRMSKQDVKDEMKQMEGNQQVKGQIRRRARDIAFRRMMQEVPKADVVVTNPTHFAIALKYDGNTMAAPQVVAKGADHLAQQVKRRAAEFGIPMVENRPLAQTLYRTVEVGDAVPADLYQAVAEVLAYVYRVRQTMRR